MNTQLYGQILRSGHKRTTVTRNRLCSYSFSILAVILPALAFCFEYFYQYSYASLFLILGVPYLIDGVQLLLGIPLRFLNLETPYNPGKSFMTFAYRFYSLSFIILFPIALVIFPPSLGLVLTWGILGGLHGLVVGHSFIHSKNSFERFLGKVHFTMVSYPHFITSHIRGHHNLVSKQVDFDSAKLNQSIYSFFLIGCIDEFIFCWQTSRKRVQREILTRLAIILGIFLLLGPTALLTYLAICFFSRWCIESINYLQHYGLKRIGATIKGHHSWDILHKGTYWFYLGANFHGDHHLNPITPNWETAPNKRGPYLPYSFPTLFFMSFIPPLFFKVLNPLAEKANKYES